MIRTANPALNEKAFQSAKHFPMVTTESMTVSGTVNRTFILLLLLVATASWSWQQALLGQAGAYTLLGALGGFVVALVTIFKKAWSPYTAPLYALLEGLFLGAISAVMEAQYPGIAIQAVMGTFGTLGGLLLAYKSGLIKPTENFKLGLVAATGGIAFIYFVSMILGFFGVAIPYIHGNGSIGILFSVGVVVIAALNLVLDFDLIENGEASGAPKFMEWYAAFGLLVTLVWLYIEILRLLSKLRSRD